MKPEPIIPESIYHFKVKNLNGETVMLDHYHNKVLLIVNTASECGFTPQYAELEILYKLYRNRGFEVLAFPSNDFGKQEPLTGTQLETFCSTQYQTSFPLFERIHVKGPAAIPLYQFLANTKKNKKSNGAPKWNFHKYLINRQGEVADYFYSPTSPCSARVKAAIEKLL